MRATTDHSHSLSDNDHDSVDNNLDSRRRSMSIDSNSHSPNHHQERESTYSSESTQSNNNNNSGHQQQGYYEHTSHHSKNNNSYNTNNNNGSNGHSTLDQYDHYNNNNSNSRQHTPSPPLPPASSLSLLASSAAEVFQGRTLPPIEPSHPLHSYMSNSRRGSVVINNANNATTDQEYSHQPSYSDRDVIYRRPSITVQDASSPSNIGSTSPSSLPLPYPSSSNGNRGQYYNSNHGTNGGGTSPQSSHVVPGGLSPTQLRHSELSAAVAQGGRRESLPSIHSSAGPLGQLLAQEFPRRHSIAHHLHHTHPNNNNNNSVGDPLLTGGVGPLKRKSSGTRRSQVHMLSDHILEHPAKRRDSIPDIATSSAAVSQAGAGHSQGNYPYHQNPLPGHHHHVHHGHGHSPYSPRSSFSAPSSPSRRGSIATVAGTSSTPAASVPSLNLQPPAETKPSSTSSMMEYGRPHYPLHQPRRPSLLSDSGSRRSSVADLHHPYNSTNGGSPSSPYPPHEYDHRMNVDMERMHLSSQGPEPLMKSGSTAPPHPSTQLPGAPPLPLQQHHHLYHGYNGPNGTSPNGVSATAATMNEHLLVPPKGDTPYSRSPELRISHKLAERKRRKEMKDLFDELRDSLPVDRSLKTSKWEILSKAVDYISSMREEQAEMAKEVEALRQEISRLQQQKKHFQGQAQGQGQTISQQHFQQHEQQSYLPHPQQEQQQ